MNNELFDFNQNVVKNQDIYTTLYGKLLILKKVEFYDGPITLQYLPYGGIQSVFNYNLIINTKSGLIIPKYVIYDDKKYQLKDFLIKYKNLVNLVLPN